VIWDDNVGNAARGGDEESDAAFSILASAARRFQLTGSAALTVAGSLDSLTFDDFEGLSRISPGLRVSYSQKFALGAQAPWVSLASSTQFQNFRDAKRVGWMTEAEVRFGKRVGERWGFDVAGGYGWRRADSAVFEAKAFQAASGFEVFLGKRTSLRGRYRLRRGDVTSSGAPDPDVNRISDGKVWDPVFGPNVRTYRFDATAHSAEIGLNWAVRRDASVEVRYEHLLARAGGGIQYGADRFGTHLLFRF